VPDLTTNLCGIALKNPTVLASGVLGTCKSILRRVARAGAGAVTIKSISALPRGGHPNPTILTFEAGLINAVGYSNAGLEEALQEFASLDDVGAPVIAERDRDECGGVLAAWPSESPRCRSPRSNCR